MNYKNKDVVDKLVKEHSSALVRFLTRRMKSREDAEDIAQAAYLRLYTQDDLGQLSNAKAFLFQVAANMSIDQLRREVLHKNYLDKQISKVPKDLSAMATMTPDAISLEREIEAKEALHLIHSRLEDLPQNARQAFILSRNKGWTYNQIATQPSDSAGSRDTAEMYLESLIPLARDIPWIYSLEANVSFRMTYSKDFTVRANPKLALRYRPRKDLLLRTNLSTGFRAPSLFELHQIQSTTQIGLYDPCSNVKNAEDLVGCTATTDPLRGQYNVIGGGNVMLRPETSKHLSLGLIYKPVGLENFTFGVDIYAIDVDQVIGANAQFIVNQNATDGQFADQIVRSDDGELISIMATNNNIGSRQIRGADIDISWRMFIASWGTLGVNMGGAYIDSHRFKIDAATNVMELAGSFVDKAAQGSGSIPKWKSLLNLFWEFGRWEFSLASMHVSSLNETIVSENRSRESGAWSIEDVQLSYHFNSGESLITLGVENILDQMPPFLGSAFNDNFDVRTHDSTGRFVYARLSHSL